MAAIFAFDPCKAAVKVATVKIPEDHILYIRPPESISPLIAIIPDHFKMFKMILGTAKIITCPRLPRPINITSTSGKSHKTFSDNLHLFQMTSHSLTISLHKPLHYIKQIFTIRIRTCRINTGIFPRKSLGPLTKINTYRDGKSTNCQRAK
jgi:hypothetical protein